MFPEKIKEAKKHVPQIHIKFPSQKSWSSHGQFKRYALWPKAGRLETFQIPHWTAYYRFLNGSRFEQEPSEQKACCQIFVCQGAIEVSRANGFIQKVSAGDFICGMYSEKDLANMECFGQTFLIVKYQADNLETIDNKFRPQTDLTYIPYFYGHGKVNDFESALLHGSPFKNPTNLAAIVRFPKGTIVSSHYHGRPVFHEFIYLQGGHLTPDGFYGPGDHVTSIPQCKEGPWLATYEPSREKLPLDWPQFTSEEKYVSDVVMPWERPFLKYKPDDIYGLLFVHGGPFVNILAGINWHVIGAGELGPEG